jgi:hypothetical protein
MHRQPVRLGWHELPQAARAAIEQHGRVLGVEPIGQGINSAFTATLHTETGIVFCKGARDDGGMLRREATINPGLPPYAPRLRWMVEVDDWTFAAFDHVTGRRANFAPGSPDLARLRSLFTEPWPAPPTLTRQLATRWAELPGWALLAQQFRDRLNPWAQQHLPRLVELEADAPNHVSGNDLLHTDLSPLNFLINDQVWLVDWAWACRGPAWVDVAFLVLRLIHAGHSCTEAESWAATVPTWAQASDEELLAFAVAISGIWDLKSRTDPAPHRDGLTEAARRWLVHRYDHDRMDDPGNGTGRSTDDQACPA